MQLDIQSFVDRIDGFTSREQYRKALRELSRYGGNLFDECLDAESRRQVLFRACEVYCFSQRFAEAKGFIKRIEIEFPEVLTDADFIALKSQLCIDEGNIEEALKILSWALKRRWPEDSYHFICYYLSKAHFWNGDYISADRLLQECYRYYASRPHKEMLGNVEYLLGYMAFQRGLLDIAACYYERARINFEASQKYYKLGCIYLSLAIISYRKGDYSKARSYLGLSRKCFIECSDHLGIISCRIAEGRLSLIAGDYERAREIFQSTLRSADKIGYKRASALSAEFLGESHYHLGNYAEALRLLQLAENLALEIAPRGDISVEVYRRLGDVYLALNEMDRAEEALTKASELAHHLQDKYELGTVLRAMGLLASHRDDIALAKAHFDEAISTLSLMKERYELARTYLAASREYRSWGASSKIMPQQRDELLAESRSHAVEAMHIFSSLGFENKVEECQELVRRLNHEGSLALAGSELRPLVFDGNWLFEGILVARSRHMLDVVSRVREFAQSELPVLVVGETGTGKETVVKLLHMLSDRSGGPFVAVNCASIPAPLFESEFFGHSRGAFTGAVANKIGLFEQASGGTLFLDEISELSNRQQAKLLRALQEGAIRRVGETCSRAIDVRIAAASNEDIEDLLAGGRLRADFYYRIAGQVVRLEPLRNRCEDIEALFAYYVTRSSDGYLVEEEALKKLEGYCWPGNVRELMNVANALLVASRDSKVIRVCDLPERIRDGASFESRIILRKRSSGKSKEWALGSASIKSAKELILTGLDEFDGNRSALARALGISRSTLYRRLRELKPVGK